MDNIIPYSVTCYSKQKQTNNEIEKNKQTFSKRPTPCAKLQHISLENMQH